MKSEVFIPEHIIVHLGKPDQSAENVWVSFPDYIKNVASSEIFPTWPEAALRANIYTQISFALNRIFTEFYPSKGYNFDITNSTQFDQAFVYGRDIFENVSLIVDDIFNDYLTIGDSVEPFFSQFCNGTTTKCDGLSQWGTVDLAKQGFTPYQILTNYYGDNVNIVRNAPIEKNVPSYSGIPLRFGSTGNDVRTIQVALNRIGKNYPAIPKIPQADGVFGEITREAVKKFQSIFNLPVDGVVGKATWYKISFLNVSVKKLTELNSEGVKLADISKQFPKVLKFGSRELGVKVLQYYLLALSLYNPENPPVQITGYFGEQTKNAVIAFQKQNGIVADGVVGNNTWNLLYRAYKGVADASPSRLEDFGIVIFPGIVLKKGSTGSAVMSIQTYLAEISKRYPTIPTAPINGVYGQSTYDAVNAFQKMFGITPDGSVGAITWDVITGVYYDIMSEKTTDFGQYPGYILKQNM